MTYEGAIVLSSPRSGSTLLQRLLGAHPDLAAPPETNVFNGAARFLREEPVASGFGVGTVSGFAFAGLDEDELHRSLREFVFGLLDALRKRSGGKRYWVEKSPFDMFHVDTIARLCGQDVRYLWLVRHPLDVIVSTKGLFDEMGIFPFEFHDYIRSNSSPLEAIAQAWVDTNRDVERLASQQPDQILKVRYEDLVTDGPGELTRIFQFLGLELTGPEAFVAKALNEGGAVGLGDWKTYEKRTLTRKQIGRWRSKGIPGPMLTRLNSIVRPLAEQLGYTDLPASHEETPEQARHRYQIERMVAHLGAGERT